MFTGRLCQIGIISTAAQLFIFVSCFALSTFFLDNGLQARLYGDMVNLSISVPQAAPSGNARGSLKKRMNVVIFAFRSCFIWIFAQALSSQVEWNELLSVTSELFIHGILTATLQSARQSNYELKNDAEWRHHLASVSVPYTLGIFWILLCRHFDSAR